MLMDCLNPDHEVLKGERISILSSLSPAANSFTSFIYRCLYIARL